LRAGLLDVLNGLGEAPLKPLQAQSRHTVVMTSPTAAIDSKALKQLKISSVLATCLQVGACLFFCVGAFSSGSLCSVDPDGEVGTCYAAPEVNWATSEGRATMGEITFGQYQYNTGSGVYNTWGNVYTYTLGPHVPFLIAFIFAALGALLCIGGTLGAYNIYNGSSERNYRLARKLFGLGLIGNVIFWVHFIPYVAKFSVRIASDSLTDEEEKELSEEANEAAHSLLIKAVPIALEGIWGLGVNVIAFVTILLAMSRSKVVVGQNQVVVEPAA